MGQSDERSYPVVNSSQLVAEQLHRATLDDDVEGTATDVRIHEVARDEVKLPAGRFLPRPDEPIKGLVVKPELTRDFAGTRRQVEPHN
jgi:hypothetical protein